MWTKGWSFDDDDGAIPLKGPLAHLKKTQNLFWSEHIAVFQFTRIGSLRADLLRLLYPFFDDGPGDLPFRSAPLLVTPLAGQSNGTGFVTVGQRFRRGLDGS